MKNTIIMVDDNENMRNGFKNLFERVNFKVIAFATAQEAKKHLSVTRNRHSVLAIVSDLMMAPTDGLEFLSDLKKNPELSGLDFFLLTGATISVFEPFFNSFDLTGVIEKPFNSKNVIAMFTELRSKVNSNDTKLEAA